MNNKLQPTSHERRATSDEFSAGSALILAVVLTSLLAVIGVVFLLAARIDKMAASAFSENRELDFAVETVVTKISRELVLDVPGISGQEYYDYPDANNAWLASLEPNDKRIWPQITDLTGLLGGYSKNVLVKIVGEYDAIADPYTPFTTADADGDGVGDSKWVILTDVTSTKGKPIHVAVRIIDLGGMLNANIAFKFDPADPCAAGIDGHSQMQINLAALSQRGANGTLAQAADKLQAWRCGTMPTDIRSSYEPNVIWRYGSPAGAYTPFDIGDELELRNRFLINLPGIDSRIENVWTNAFKNPNLRTPVPWDDSATVREANLTDWFYRAQHDVIGPNDIYSYRHIATTCNMDRIINPLGASLNNRKMVDVNTDVNTPDKDLNLARMDLLFRAIYAGLYDANFPSVDVAAQITANLIDFRDGDDSITAFDPPPPGGRIYYGFERPCIYISELDYNSVTVTTGSPPTTTTYKSYAVELYKPYSEDDIPRPARPGAWRLFVSGVGTPIAIDIGSPSWPPGKSFYVIQKQDLNARIAVDPNALVKDSMSLVLSGNSNVELQRSVIDPNGTKFITVDSISVPGWLVSGDGLRGFQHDISKHKSIRRLWDSASKTPTLGKINSYVDNSRPELIQARPANKPFTNIGEIGMVFSKAAYYRDPADRDKTIGYSIIANEEKRVLVNLADPLFQRIFNYLTVFDPAVYPWNDPNETRVKGRINVNTAPWFVIAQLPWMWPHIAQATVAFRDKTLFPGGADYRNRPGVMGFGSIGELMNVAEMGFYTYDNIDLNGFPDLTPNDGDGIQGNFEERDIIFHRISNLVTVRSDVFTAYILVRIGADGPQRRVMAILDRSQVRSSADKVKIIALYPVPDPR